MKRIGFTNFRRFADFPEMDFNGVTLLVGGNNSGKSTLVKAILLCADNLKILQNLKSDYIEHAVPVFRFDGNEWHDVKIKTFGRALNYNAEEHKITFSFKISGFTIELSVVGEKGSDDATGLISRISIEENVTKLRVCIDYQRDVMSLDLHIEDMSKNIAEMMLFSISQMRKEIESEDDFSKTADLSSRLDNILQNLDEMLGLNDVDHDTFNYETAINEFFSSHPLKGYSGSLELPREEYPDVDNGNLFLHIVNNFICAGTKLGQGTSEEDGTEKTLDDEKNEEEEQEGSNDNQMEEDDDDREEELNTEEEARKLLMTEFEVMSSFKVYLARALANVDIEYISAHSVNQNTIYNTSDRNDYIAQVVHEFYQCKVSAGERENLFIKKYMKLFGIGSDYRISLIDGEAYRVKITTFDGLEVNMADLGMGSIQLMVLLFKLATIISEHKHVRLNEESVMPTILIEEPEQNLHPDNQSLLADLFREMYEDYGCNLIVETHSEYLVRRTQVIVKDCGFASEKEADEASPFNVYFFNKGDSEVPYYKMKYRPDGCFANDFGEGFMDIAEKLAFEII